MSKRERLVATCLRRSLQCIEVAPKPSMPYNKEQHNGNVSTGPLPLRPEMGRRPVEDVT
jgi:hypothetical protein